MFKKRNTLYGIAAPLILSLAILGGTVPMPGCNSKKVMSEASEAAKDIGGGVRDVIKAVGEAYDKKLITLEQKDRFADLLIAIAKGGQKGVAALEALEKSGVTDINADQSAILNKIFDNEVISPFLDLISELAKLTDAQSTAIRAALSGVRTAILLFSRKIGRNDIQLMIEQREKAQHA